MRHADRILDQLNLDEEQRILRDTVRDFTTQELTPNVIAWERAHQPVPDEFIAKMGELGLFGITVPEAHGGSGGGMRELILAGFELGYASPSVGITLGAGISLGIKPILLAGNEEQKRTHLEPMAAGKYMGCFGLTEPNVGSDAEAAECRAAFDESRREWVINGSKHFSTNSRWSRVCVVHAMTSPEARKGHRTSCFLVEMDTPGLTRMEMEGKTGWILSSTGFLGFDDVRVPESALLGEKDEGFLVMMKTLDGGRLFVAALGLASIAACLDASATYARERHQFGKPIGSYQRIQDMLVDMDESLERGLIWLWHAATRYDQGVVDRLQSAKVKRVCTEDAVRCTSRAMQLFGGASYIDESGVYVHYRDARVLTIGEGANEVLAGLVARSLLDAR